MSIVYIPVLADLRDEVTLNGIDPKNGGFHFLDLMPEDVSDDIDIWVVDLADVGLSGDCTIVSQSIPSHALRLEERHSLRPN